MRSLLLTLTFFVFIGCISCKSESQVSKLESSSQHQSESRSNKTSKKHRVKEFKFEEESSSKEKIGNEGLSNEKVDKELLQIDEKKEKALSKKSANKSSKEIKSKSTTPKAKKIKKPKKKKIGKLQFIQKEFDFGFIEVGEVVNHKFKFVNTGNAPVNISNATASCGCTTPVFPFLEIEPGKSGEIGVHFNSKDRLGSQTATVVVYSDAVNSEQELNIKGVVRSEIVSPSEFIDTLK